MPKDRNLIFVLADGEHARFIRPAADNGLHTQADLDSPFAHMRSSALGSDRPGAAFHSNSTQHHAKMPRHDPHDLEKAAFAKDIAMQLNDAAARGVFEELVLIAPPHTLNGIEAALDGTAKQRLIGTLAKDLIKTPDHELWPHVHEWIRPVHRAR
jgi:protein required for attachment to host cells